MELEEGKIYHAKDENNWTFICWIPDRKNPGKKLASFSRIEKHERFINEDKLEIEIIEQCGE